MRKLSNSLVAVKRRERVARYALAGICSCGRKKEKFDDKRCKHCVDKYPTELAKHNARRARNKNAYYGIINREADLKKKYGITSAQYEEMLRLQGGACAICGGIGKEGRRLNVDHDHSSGKVRQLLCFKCNIALGAVNDSILILDRMKEYLLTHNK